MHCEVFHEIHKKFTCDPSAVRNAHNATNRSSVNQLRFVCFAFKDHHWWDIITCCIACAKDSCGHPPPPVHH